MPAGGAVSVATAAGITFAGRKKRARTETVAESITDGGLTMEEYPDKMPPGDMTITVDRTAPYPVGRFLSRNPKEIRSSRLLTIRMYSS